MRKLLKIIICIITVFVSFVYIADFPENGGTDKDIILRRNYIISSLDQSGPFFKSHDVEFTGEWTLVTYSMASFALTNIAMSHPDLSKESAEIIARWIDICLSFEIRQFDEAAWQENPLDESVMQKDEGHIGYYGHLNLMLGCYGLLANDGKFNGLHSKISQAIAKRMRRYPHRHVETYPAQNYPPDSILPV